MRATSYHPADDIDLAKVWREVRGKLVRIGFVAVAAGALTYGVLTLFAPRYTSAAELAIVAKGTANPFTDPSRDSGGDSISVRMDKEAINSHVRALGSSDLAVKIAEDLKLADRAEFNSELGAPDTMSRLLRLVGIGGPRAGEGTLERVLEVFFERLEVYSPRESRFVGIQFTSMDPELAAEVPNRLAEAYRASLAGQSVSETDGVQKALEPKIARLLAETAEAEAAVERFRGEANIFKGQQATGLNEQQLAELTAELTRVKASRGDAEARMRAARELVEAGSAEALPDVQKSPLIQSLAEQRVRVERQISELSATLLPGHPRMRQLKADLAGLKRQIATEVTKIVDGLSKEVKVAALREDAIKTSIGEIKTRIVDTGPNEAKLRGLEAGARTKRAELERLQAQFEANRVRADSRAIPVEAQFVSSARPSSVPSFPKKRSYVVLVAGAVLLLGLALAIARALLAGEAAGVTSAALPRSEPVAPVRNRPVESTSVPPPPPAREPARDPLPSAPGVVAGASFDLPENDGSVEPVAMPAPTLAEIARRIAALEAPDGSGLRTLVTGATDPIAPGAEAAELGKLLEAGDRSVLVVDWGVNAANVHPGRRGMTDVIAGSATFDAVIATFPDSSVQFIPTGTGGAEALLGVDTDRINLILDALDEVYDHILIVGRREAARRLFETLEGRFDAGVLVSDGRRPPLTVHPDNTFLGFEVEGLEVIWLERAENKPKAADRLARAAGGTPASNARSRPNNEPHQSGVA